MARNTPLDPDARRAQLLSTARSVFARNGYQATSVADIIQSAGVARGTFYNYFESKRAVFQAVLDELMERISEVVTPLDAEGDLAEQLRANLERVLTVLTREDAARILFADAVGLDAEGDDALRAFYGAATRLVVTALEAGRSMGLVEVADAQFAARCLVGMIKEPIFQAWLYGERLDAVRLVDALMPLVVGGVNFQARPRG